MKQLNAEFIISAADKSGWPELDKPEVVVVGRSNVGKSSFINALTNRKKLAYVGSTPGKTQLLNFFDIDGQWTLVDVPGYGYAKLSRSQIEKMGKMMDEYFGEREGIKCVISLVDARHAPSADDKDMIQYFKDNGFQVLVGATKVDKVPKTKRLSNLKKISKDLQLPMKVIFPISAVEKTGLDEIYTALMERISPADPSEEAVSQGEPQPEPAASADAESNGATPAENPDSAAEQA